MVIGKCNHWYVRSAWYLMWSVECSFEALSLLKNKVSGRLCLATSKNSSNRMFKIHSRLDCHHLTNMMSTACLNERCLCQEEGSCVYKHLLSAISSFSNNFETRGPSFGCAGCWNPSKILYAHRRGGKKFGTPAPKNQTLKQKASTHPYLSHIWVMITKHFVN